MNSNQRVLLARTYNILSYAGWAWIALIAWLAYTKPKALTDNQLAEAIVFVVAGIAEWGFFQFARKWTQAGGKE